MSDAIIEIKNVNKYYDGKLTVKNLSLTINRGEFVSILGPSGSGKSTMMNIIGCLDKASSGQYVLSGRDIKDLDEKVKEKIEELI